MKALERIKLIDEIASKMQSTLTFRDIDALFITYGIPTDHVPSYNSKAVYVKEVLPKIDNNIIFQIADELKIDYSSLTGKALYIDSSPSFWKSGHFKLFISHLASFKNTISALKCELEKYGISSFVAHEDIEPTMEWQVEIEKGLFTMDALCAVLMPKFKESNWTDQEIGVAIGRDVLVVPIRRELDPYGFIGKYQGYQALGKNLNEVAEGVFMILAKNPKTRNKLINCLIDLFISSNDSTDAYNRILSLKKINDLPEEMIKRIRNSMVENNILKNKDILSEINLLFKLYEIKSIQFSDFEKTNVFNPVDLPF